MSVISNRRLGDELHRRGLLPDDCRLVDIVIGIDNATVIRYETLVSADKLGLIADAMKAVSDASKSELVKR